MTAKDNLCAAFERRQPEVVPLWDIHFHIWNQVSGRHLVIGAEYAALSAAEQERAIAADAELMAAAALQLGLAGITIPDNYWEIAPGTPTYYWLPGAARLKLAAALSRLVGDQVMVVSGTGGILGMPGPGEYVDFSYRLYDAPEEIDALAYAALQHALEDAPRLRDAGVEAAYCAADLADNHGPYFSPAQMQRYILPYLPRWAEGARAAGLYTLLHTDGNIMPILADLANSGIHALQAIDPVAGMDMRRVKTLVGDRVCLCGNVDSGLLVTGPAEAIYAQTCSLLDECKDGGGLVLGASNAVFQETPLEHYMAMVRAWRAHGRY
jgi:uroporphyrinogen decarboxylase